MSPGDREILDHFIRTRDKTMALLESVPEEMLASQAEGEKRDTRWVFEHIGVGGNWWMEHVARDGRGWTRETGGLCKARLHDVLLQSRQRLLEFFEKDDGAAMSETFTLPGDEPKSLSGRWKVLYLTQHESHHRGKLVLALRQWGMTDFPFLPY